MDLATHERQLVSHATQRSIFYGPSFLERQNDHLRRLVCTRYTRYGADFSDFSQAAMTLDYFIDPPKNTVDNACHIYQNGILNCKHVKTVRLLNQMEYDDESVRLLLEELDEDKSGSIDFEEFCSFLARVK